LFCLLIPVLLFTLSCKRKAAKEEASVTPAEAGKYPPKSLKKVTVYPYWVTNCQYAGYYVGREKGIYRKYGIDLNILEFKPFVTTNEIIAQKQTDFAILWLVNAIQLRNSGIPIVNIAQFSTRSSLMLIAKKSSGITKIEDLNGKRAGIWDGYDLQPQTLFSRYHLNTEIVHIGSTNNLFLQGGVDVTNANWFDEYHAILNSGYDSSELVRFFFSDYGLNFLEDGIYCLQDKLKEDPEICVAFVKATIESWIYALNHRKESVEIILKYQRQQNMPANRSHQTWMIERYRDLYLPEGAKTMNIMLKEKDYLSNAEVLLQNKLIVSITPYKEFFKPYYSLNHSSSEK
jgi:NitT/TauT family transport system substrate-binding protein